MADDIGEQPGSHEPTEYHKTKAYGIGMSARETYRIHLNDLGVKGATPVPQEEYERIRAAA